MKKGTTYKKITESQKIEMMDFFVSGYTNDEGMLQLPTIAEVAKKYKMSENTLYKIAQKGEWKIKQSNNALKFHEKISKQKREMLSTEGYKIDDRIINVSKQLLDNVVKNIEAKQKLSPFQIDSLASASLKIQKMAKLALGESTENLNIESNTSTDEHFREALELIDQIRIERIRTEGSTSTH